MFRIINHNFVVALYKPQNKPYHLTSEKYRKFTKP